MRMILADSTRVPEHDTPLPEIRSDPDSVRRASRFLTDIPARNQALMFPETWDLPDGDGHAFCLDGEWRVLAVAVLRPAKVFVPERGSWYPGWTYYFSRDDDIPRRCANVYLLLPSSGQATLLPRRQVREAIARGLEGGMADTTRPTVLPDPPLPWRVHPYSIAYTVSALLDEPLTSHRDSRYDSRLSISYLSAKPVRFEWTYERWSSFRNAFSERQVVEILLESEQTLTGDES
jgi:hypothetical protein